jgi:RimJ/RimL family protein N-acetyltransferase
MAKVEMTLRRADPEDITAIMAIERVPDFEDCVGRSSHVEHKEMLASPRYTYFLGLGPRGDALGFAILRDFDDPHGNLYLKRIAVAHPGEGLGTAFLRGLLEWAFTQTAAQRFYLDCFAHNARAQRLYAKFGFTRDGILRQAYRSPDGARKDLVLMALLKDEWSQRL